MTPEAVAARAYELAPLLRRAYGDNIHTTEVLEAANKLEALAAIVIALSGAGAQKPDEGWIEWTNHSRWDAWDTDLHGDWLVEVEVVDYSPQEKRRDTGLVHTFDWRFIKQYRRVSTPPSALLDEVVRVQLEEAAKAGWNACRKSLYAVCEDIRERAAAVNKVSLATTPEQQAHERGYYFGEDQAAESIARGFNAMEAGDDDNFREALTHIEQERQK